MPTEVRPNGDGRDAEQAHLALCSAWVIADPLLGTLFSAFRPMVLENGVVFAFPWPHPKNIGFSNSP